MAIYEELEIDQGSTFRYEIILTEKDGTPSNLTSYTVKSEIRKNYKSLTVSGEFTTEFTEANPLLGKIILSLTDEETIEIKAGRYLFDVIITNSSGFTTRIMEGGVEVTPRVTR